MRKDRITRVLYSEELQKINNVIIPLYGTRARVESGSYVIVKGQKNQINIVLGETNAYNSADNLKCVAKHVKKIMGTQHEIYSFGIKLA